MNTLYVVAWEAGVSFKHLNTNNGMWVEDFKLRTCISETVTLLTAIRSVLMGEQRVVKVDFADYCTTIVAYCNSVLEVVVVSKIFSNRYYAFSYDAYADSITFLEGIGALLCSIENTYGYRVI